MKTKIFERRILTEPLLHFLWDILNNVDEHREVEVFINGKYKEISTFDLAYLSFHGLITEISLIYIENSTDKEFYLKIDDWRRLLDNDYGFPFTEYNQILPPNSMIYRVKLVPNREKIEKYISDYISTWLKDEKGTHGLKSQISAIKQITNVLVDIYRQLNRGFSKNGLALKRETNYNLEDNYDFFCTLLFLDRSGYITILFRKFDFEVDHQSFMVKVNEKLIELGKITIPKEQHYSLEMGSEGTLERISNKIVKFSGEKQKWSENKSIDDKHALTDSLFIKNVLYLPKAKPISFANAQAVNQRNLMQLLVSNINNWISTKDIKKIANMDNEQTRSAFKNIGKRIDESGVKKIDRRKILVSFNDGDDIYCMLHLPN